jgi:hypothetical protein
VKEEMGRKRTAEESEILVGGCKDNKQMEQPAETSVGPYGRAVRNVFCGGGHVGFGKMGVY